ncbi:unnamed protein product [Phytophthora lilii]|uniref:Unnamed protein product n=1 Tax=Phytophthora lilii TaxID=2077276 RepID=A0A9W6WVC3_9STRA|nr:unnamed protein product [Phytophthora lilii]
MVKRYLQLLEFLDVEDDDIMDVMPAPAVTKRMRSLSKELKDVESVSKALQGGDVDLLDVLQWFDDLIVIEPQYAHYLGKHKARDSNEHAHTNVRLNAARSQGKHRPQPRLRGGLCACPSR